VAFADKMHRTAQIGLFAFCIVAVLFSIVRMGMKQLKWLRWPCPRCGCAFRGFLEQAVATEKVRLLWPAESR